MPKAYPPEFRARAVALVRAGKPVRQTARELEISESCLRNWMTQAGADENGRNATRLTSAERKES